MKRIVNGVEAELSDAADVAITEVGGRMAVRTAEGTFTALAVQAGDSTRISYMGRQFLIESGRKRTRADAETHSGEIRASMPGLITDVCVKSGDNVQRGDKLVVLEAMKTQQAFVSPMDGSVEIVHVRPNEQVSEGQLLVLVAPIAENGPREP